MDLRNEIFQWLASGVIRRSGTVLLAETWSLFLGLETVVFLQIKTIEIETDSQTIFNLVIANDFHPLTMLISNCRDTFSSSLKTTSFSKSIEGCADLLAKNAQQRKTPQTSYSPPLLFTITYGNFNYIYTCCNKLYCFIFFFCFFKLSCYCNPYFSL